MPIVRQIPLSRAGAGNLPRPRRRARGAGAAGRRRRLQSTGQTKKATRLAAARSMAQVSTRASSPAPTLLAGWPWTVRTSTGPTKAPTPSAVPTSTAPTDFRTSSSVPKNRSGWLSTAIYSTGPTGKTARSGVPTSMAQASIRASSPASASRWEWPSTALNLLGQLQRHQLDRPGKSQRHERETRASSPAPASPAGWRVDGCRISTGPTIRTARSAGRISTAPVSTRAS